MLRLKYPFVVFMVIVALCGMSMTTIAQGEILGSLTIGQPVISEISADTTPRYDLTLAESSIVTRQLPISITGSSKSLCCAAWCISSDSS